MSSTYIRAEAIGRVGRGGAARRWVGGVAAALVVGGALAAAVAWPEPPAATRRLEVPAAPAIVAIDQPAGGVVEGPFGYEWRVPAAVAVAQPAGGVVEGPWGYQWVAPAAPAVKEYMIEGPFGYELVRVRPAGPVTAAPASPVFSVPGVGRWIDGAQGYAFEATTAADGYYDEGPQGYEWRLRAGR